MSQEVDPKLLNKMRMMKNISYQSLTEEKIEQAKRKSLRIVEDLIDPSVSEELLRCACDTISQDEYLDIIEERNILLLCGYPLCSKEVKPIKQKYHISVKSNKVYDITERKCYCSNICYKASNFLKAQLSTIPVWLKDTDAEGEPIKLLLSTQNSGSAGEEIDLGHKRMTTHDIEKVPDKEDQKCSENMNSLRISDDLEMCARKLKELDVSEQLDSLENTLLLSEAKDKFGLVDDEDSNVKYNGDRLCLLTEEYENKVNSPALPAQQYECIDSDDDLENCDRLMLDHKNSESLITSNKYMPMIPKTKIRKAILIDPTGNPDDRFRLSLAAQKQINSLELIQSALISWVTLETFCIILGEDKYESFRSKILEEAEATPSAELQSNVDKLKVMKESYTKMCWKLEKEEAVELNSNSIGDNEKLGHDKVQGEQLSESTEALEQLKVSMFYKGEMGLPEAAPPVIKNKGKKLKPAQGKSSKKDCSAIIPRFPIKRKETEPVTASAPREGNVLPVVESLSQSTIRKRIVAGNLKTVYTDILPLVGLNYRDISEDLRLLISTFSLSPTNITFKPFEWKMVAVILFRMIDKMLTTEKMWAQENCWQLLETKLISFNISLDQIDTLLAAVTDYSHFKKLLGY